MLSCSAHTPYIYRKKSHYLYYAYVTNALVVLQGDRYNIHSQLEHCKNMHHAYMCYVACNYGYNNYPE